MIECCFRCHAPASVEELTAGAEWHVLVSDEGHLLGVACSDCLADEDLALIELHALHGLPTAA